MYVVTLNLFCSSLYDKYVDKITREHPIVYLYVGGSKITMSNITKLIKNCGAKKFRTEMSTL